MNRKATTIAVLIMLISLSAPALASEGHVEEDVPAEISSMTNPIQMTTTSVENGKAIYAKNCAGCHGTEGRGDGPLADALPEKPTDFTDSAMVGDHTEGELFYKTKKGVGDYMPGFESQLTDEEMWHVINYLRSIEVSDAGAEKPASEDTEQAVPMKTRPEVVTLKNPIPKDNIAFTAGEEIYGLYCYRCHGEGGKGNTGNYAKSVLSEAPSDLSASSLINQKTDGEFFYIIKYGGGEMPSHEEYLQDVEIWQTVNYIRTFEGLVPDETVKDDGSGTLLWAVFLLVLVLIAYAVKRR
jgi:mono/diheme cytochrome c family protein